jgi:hypothetical protein
MSARLVPPLVSLSPESDHLREEVRAFLDEERIAGGFVPRWTPGSRLGRGLQPPA